MGGGEKRERVRGGWSGGRGWRGGRKGRKRGREEVKRSNGEGVEKRREEV